MIPLLDRFTAKYIPEPNSGCWLWTGAALPNGYGLIGAGRRNQGHLYAHRASYELHCGAIPQGSYVLHRCDNPWCVNPDHLFVGTQADNMEDKRKKGRALSHEKHPNSILTTEIVASIRSEYAAGDTSLSILGRKHRIGTQHVHDIVRNKIWRSL